MITLKGIAACWLVLFVLVAAADVSSAGREKMGTPLRLLMDLHSSPPAQSQAPESAAAALRADRVTLTVKFDHVLSESEIKEYESRGGSFFRIDGEIARTASIYPVSVPWSMVEEMGAERGVLRLEASWHPAVYPMLDVSAEEIEAKAVWGHDDPLGHPLTGKGLRIADFDTGIDVFHPSFFYADGDTFSWVDAVVPGTFTPGWDCIDLNRNGLADANEKLRYTDGWIYDPAHVWGLVDPSNNGNGLQTYWDWVYNDANANGARDYGTAAGYTESSPTFGERVFVHLDQNGNGAVDLGEKFVALGTSKIYATMNAGHVERVRGTNVILSDQDTNGHGTSVSGILAGGTVGRHIFTGVAPEAEILMGYFFSDNPISLLIPWARSRGADVMLYEFGSFVFDFLDGSSLDEELVSIENETILQVTPSGNLARGNKHAIATVPAAGSTTLWFNAPLTAITELWETTLWRTSQSHLRFYLKSPRGSQAELTVSPSYLDGYYISFERDTSPRGTCKLDLYIGANTNGSCVGTWELRIANSSASPIETIDNVADNATSWAGGAEWTMYATNQRNVTWPATADSAFCNGSYSTRGFEGYDGVGTGSISVGEISAFSGRGPRIDGKHLLDICSPGNYDVYSTRSHQDGGGYPVGGYRQFSGTSAAGPHVAAAAALVRQAYPSADMNEVALHLTSSAVSDEFTGDVYNDTWGYGKLRILGAVGLISGIEEMVRGDAPPALVLGANYPNPFNPSTWIPFFLPSEGKTRLTIYDVRGGTVRVLADKQMNPGPHSVRWNGDDSKGQAVASGIYFCVLEHGGLSQTRKVVLIK
jgi:subtilisin family serine protease